MKTYKIILVATLLLVASKAAVAQQQTAAKKSSDKIDNLISEYVENRGFMGSVLVAEKGEVIFSKGYGLANVENNIPNTPMTQFGVGSITKQFTAMLITQLVEKGKVRLDNTISDFIPDFPKDMGDKITVEMLLSHTSGLILPEGIERYYYASTKDEFLQEYIRQLKEEGLRFESGKGYGYSNGGYFLLGLIIEKASGKSYENLLQEQILKPLGMDNTVCDRKGLVLKNRAISYRKLPDRYMSWNEEQNSYDPAIWGFGCGNIMSTVEDLFKFSKALSTNQLLSKKHMEMFLAMRNRMPRHMFAPYMSKDLINEFYGTFGNGFVGEISILNDPVTNKKNILYWHDGTNKLFISQHYHYSGKEQAIIICSNSSLRWQGDEMALKIHQLINNKPYYHVRMKTRLSEYIEDDIAPHAGIAAALNEFLRLHKDTIHFIVPGENYLLNHGLNFTEMGDFDNAILILNTHITLYPDTWKAYEALGGIYNKTKNPEKAIQCYRKVLEFCPDNTNAKEMLKNLEKALMLPVPG